VTSLLVKAKTVLQTAVFMDAKSKLDRFIWDGLFDLHWGCLGNPATGRFLLVPFTRHKDELLSKGEVLHARLGNFVFCGTFGYRARDHFADFCAEPFPEAAKVMTIAAPSFFRLLAEVLMPNPPVDWLRKLHDLPDPRGA
jgi:hypothetical protein